MILLNNRYKLLQPLGHGGSGVTYLAWDDHQQRKVVIKRYNTISGALDEAPWLREMEALRRIEHPQIPQFLDAFVAESEMVRRPHLVQSYIEGVSLDEELRETRYNVDSVVEIIADLLGILMFLQKQTPPIIHRDIKPANILRKKNDDKLVLIDFGTATEVVRKTFDNTMNVGTLGYQAPEQIAGEASIVSDLYSIGVVAIELLTRKRPHKLLKGMGEGLNWTPFIGDLPHGFRVWLEKALSLDPKDRFRNAAGAHAEILRLHPYFFPAVVTESANPMRPDSSLAAAIQARMAVERESIIRKKAKNQRIRAEKRRQLQEKQFDTLEEKQQLRIRERGFIQEQKLRQTKVSAAWWQLITHVANGDLRPRAAAEVFLSHEYSSPEFGTIAVGPETRQVSFVEVDIARGLLERQVDSELSVRYTQILHAHPRWGALKKMEERLLTTIRFAEKVVRLSREEQEYKSASWWSKIGGGKRRLEEIEYELYTNLEQRDEHIYSLQLDIDHYSAPKNVLNTLRNALLQQQRELSNLESAWQSMLPYAVLTSHLKRHLRMVRIRTGAYWVGAKANDRTAYQNERPRHEVRLRTYDISAFPVTQSLYAKVVGSNPSNFSIPEAPIDNVSWYEAVAFCNKLSAIEGLAPAYIIHENGFVEWIHAANGYRLPTEAEWEAAAKGGADLLYAGSNIIEDVGWISTNSNKSIHPVGQKLPNLLGIYDLSGNVWEWCWDWFGDYTPASVVNPKGPDTGESRVLRGGSCYSLPRYARSTNRARSNPIHCDNYFGFRVARYPSTT